MIRHSFGIGSGRADRSTSSSTATRESLPRPEPKGRRAQSGSVNIHARKMRLSFGALKLWSAVAKSQRRSSRRIRATTWMSRSRRSIGRGWLVHQQVTAATTGRA